MTVKLRVLLTLISAGLAILAFPPIGWAPLALVAWVPLVMAVGGVKPSHGVYLGMLHGLVFYGVTMSWLWDVFREARHLFVPLIMIMSLFTGFFARGYAYASSRYPAGWSTALFAACWWVGVEFFRSELFYLKFPWMTPSVGLGPTWLTPLLGVYGGSFVIIFATALVCQQKKLRIAGASVLLVMLVSAWWQTQREVRQNDSPVRVAAVQGESLDIDEYIRITRAATEDESNKIDLIIWPENALYLDMRRNKHMWKHMLNFAKETDAVMVVGTQTAEDRADGGGWRNTALTLDASGTLGEHYKNHTVHFFDDGIAGTEARAVNTSVGKIGTSICFDNDYEDVVRRMVADGAELLAIPSMDAIHWGVKEHYQHAELFRHRAAENGRWVTVAASSGVTQVIDPNGNRVASLPIIDEGVLVYEVNKERRLTVYTRFGWLFPWVTMGVSAVWVVVLFLQGLREKRDRGEHSGLGLRAWVANTRTPWEGGLRLFTHCC